jgi:hypothetical protein
MMAAEQTRTLSRMVGGRDGRLITLDLDTNIVVSTSGTTRLPPRAAEMLGVLLDERHWHRKGRPPGAGVGPIAMLQGLYGRSAAQWPERP